MRLYACVGAALFYFLMTGFANAAPYRHWVDDNWSQPRVMYRTYKHRSHKHHARHYKHRVRSIVLRDARSELRVKARVVEHPAGCPRKRFCGCGVSVKVFGKPVRELYLAANWRKFPPVRPAPGTVAWRYGHVFYILKPIGQNKAVVYDPNSGGHLTRIHVRSLAGYRVVDPRG